MATKPTTTPGWTAAGVTPTAGKKAAGFAGGERPPAQYFNWFLTLTSEWADYVADLDLDAPLILHDSGSGDGVRLEVNNADELDLRNEADDGQADIRFEDDHHGERTLLIPASKGQSTGIDGTESYTAAASANNGLRSDSTNPQTVDVPLDLRVGDRIVAITVWLFEGSSAGEEVDGKLWEVDPVAGTTTQKSTTKTSGTTSARTTIGWTSADSDVPLTLAADKLYVLSLSLPVTSGDNEIIFTGCKVVYDRP